MGGGCPPGGVEGNTAPPPRTIEVLIKLIEKKKKGFFKFGLILNNFMGTILLFFLNVVHLQPLRNDNFWG